MKMKETDEYNGEDILWAICRVGKNNVDLEDFKNIVTVLNSKGLWTPLLSTDRISWKSLKNAVDCKALNIVGRPILLLEGVHTFKEIISFAYMKGLLTNPKGKAILDLKEEASKENLKRHAQSTTLEDASKDPGVGKKAPQISAKDAIENTRKAAADLMSGLQGNRESLQLSSSEEQLTGVNGQTHLGPHGDLNLPNPVPVSMDQYGGHSVLVTHSLTPNSDTVQYALAGTSSASGECSDNRVYTTYDIIEHNNTAGGGVGQDLIAASMEAASVSADPNVVDVETSAPTTVAGFDPTKFNIDDVDNEIENLETNAVIDPHLKLGRYQDLTKKLRKSLGFACTSNQNLMRVADANDMKLREYKFFAASEVIEGLQPTMSRVDSLSKKLDKVLEVVHTLDLKFSHELSALRVELGELSASLTNCDELAVVRTNNIIRHLSSFGLVDVGSTFDIPSALQSIHKLLAEDIVPVFTSGRVQPVPYDDTAAMNPLALGQQDYAGTTESATSQHSNVGNYVAPGATQATPAVTVKQHHDGSAMVANPLVATKPVPPPGSLQTTSPVLRNQTGLLPTPVQYQDTERHYMQVPISPSAANSAMVTPQKIMTTGQQHSFIVPPPPAKQARLDGYLSGTDAVKSMFQPYNQVAQLASTAHIGQQTLLQSTGALGFSGGAPANNQHVLALQQRHLYPGPQPIAPASVIRTTAHGMHTVPSTTGYNHALGDGQGYYRGPQ